MTTDTLNTIPPLIEPFTQPSWFVGLDPEDQRFTDEVLGVIDFLYPNIDPDLRARVFWRFMGVKCG